MSNATRHRMPSVVVTSLALHAALVVAAGRAAHASSSRSPRPPMEVSVIVQPAPPPVAFEPEPEAPQPQPSAPETRVARAPRATRARPAPAAASPSPPAPSPAAPPPVADFTGLTLTNDSGTASFASAVGNGAALDGPIAARGVRSSGQGGSLVPGSGSGTGERIVPLASLSRPPRAPALDEALEDNYPPSARAQGRTGTALVRVKVLPDGRIGAMRVLSETEPGFGVACRRTLAGSRWQPPLDASGRPVATELSYTCRFEVAS